jgi:hypothetical protein
MQVVSGRGCPRRPRKGVSKLRMLGNGRKRLCLWLGFIREYIDTETKNRIDTETKNRIDTETKNRIDPYRCDYWLPCGYGLAAPSGSSQHCCRPVESQRHSTSTAVGARTPYPLRRSLLAFRIEPGQPRDAHARHANARARRSQVDAAARNSQRHVSVVSQRRVGRRSAVGRSGSCATRRGTGRDPGPCRPCTAAVSRAVDARVRIELGSHAKPGLHMRRWPLQACDGASSDMVSCALTKGTACSIRWNRFDADNL